MLIYAGIDEAGYGPMLGPLCVASSCFVIENHDPADGAPNLWETLEHAVCRSRRDTPQRIAIDDSKKLKGARSSTTQHPLKHLERGVLAFYASLHGTAAIDALNDESLLSALGAKIPELPWYKGNTDIPAASDSGTLRIAASKLERALNTQNVRLQSMRCSIIDAGPLNRGAKKLGTKAGVNMHAITRLVDQIRTDHPNEHPRIIIDRQSGRTRYRDELAMAFPDATIAIIAEQDDCSRYRLEFDNHTLTITFAKTAEDKHLPVALASMTAKYVRELLMIRLNEFFTGHLPDLAPTAGYVQDGRRYLREIKPLIIELDLPVAELVRTT